MKYKASQHLLIDSKKGPEIIKFYQEKVGMKVVISLTYGEVSTKLPECSPLYSEFPNNIFYAELLFGDKLLMLTDNIWAGDYPHLLDDEIKVLINVNQPTDVDKYAKLLSEKGKVILEPENSFIDTRVAVVQDQFGIRWTIQYIKQS